MVTDSYHVVDVLIPAFNAAGTVESAVTSIQNQTLSNIKIHVVDDGSTDETGAILKRLACADHRIQVYHRANSGIVDALNYGLTFCSAEFLARHDADDIAYPERLATQISYLHANPDVIAVGAKARHIGVDGAPLGTVADLGPPELADCDYIPSREPYIIHPLLTVRRRALREAGGYRHVLHSEDTDLYWRLIEHGRLVNLPIVLADYRLHESSISAASAVNGRIMAVNAQLAGLSARRRRSGIKDIEFPRDRIAEFKKLDTLADIVDLGALGLSDDERIYLVRASAAKFLELTTYRPYELSEDDARFVGLALGDGMPGVTSERRRVLERHLSGAAARLAAAGKWREAFHLLPSTLWPGFFARTAMRLAVPSSLHRLFQRRGTRNAFG